MDNKGKTIFTCLTCHVGFEVMEDQRKHFSTEWHSYNLKRKCAGLPPVSAETFREKVLANQAQLKAEKEVVECFCGACRRHFKNINSMENHFKSKKHISNAAFLEDEGKDWKSWTSATSKNEKEKSDEEVEEVDSDEWEGTPIAKTECLFCNQHSRNLENNLKHMTGVHGFFIPDLQYCIDVEGLISYLGQKIGSWYECIYCNEKSKVFKDLHGVQDHMRAKCHDMFKLEGEGLVEYAPYYDYSSSYPDEGDPNAEVQPNIIYDDGYELVLPSGRRIGHKAMKRYYNQSISFERKRKIEGLMPGSKMKRLLHHYHQMGLSGTLSTPQEITQRARDMRFMEKVRSKHIMQLGIKANKLQHHFRMQNPI